jgi:tetratricopeptide (TPR) repeat protein
MGYVDADYFPMLQKAETFAEELGDDKKRLLASSILGLYHIQKGGNPQLGWEYLERCAEHLEMIEDVELMVPVGVNLLSSCVTSGDYQRVNCIAPTIISLIERCGTQAGFFDLAYNPYSYAHAMWGFGKAICGDFDQGEKLLEKALSFALEIDHLSTTGIIEFICGLTLAGKGDGKGATGHLEHAIKSMEESQTVLYLGAAWAWLGHTHCLMGQSKKAVELTEKGLKIHTELGMAHYRDFCHWLCSRAYFEQGDMEQAQTHAELALQFSLENNAKMGEGLSRSLLGMVLAKTDPTRIEAAEQQILQGISLEEELGLRPLCGWGYLWLGEVYAESGRREEALENLKKAETIFRDMGMGYWLGKAQEALAGL